MRASVRLRTPDGQEAELCHGELIGRAWTSALRLDDGRVSEAHAMVSLRGEALKLLALRGVFAVDGVRRTKVTLCRGLVVHLAEDLPLEVLDVQLPAQVLAVQGDGLPRTVLSGVCSIVVDPRPSVQQGYVRGAAARMWPGPDGWTVEVPGSPPRPLEAGQAIEAEGLRARAVAVALSEAEVGATRRSGGLQSPLRLVARYDSVHLHRDGRPPVVLSGLAARLVSELVAMDGPVPWDVLACQLWPRVDDKHVRRRRLDLTLSRLRRRLADAGVRRDLLRSDGAGHVELVLDADDTVEDAS